MWGDGCSGTCIVEYCGDGTLQPKLGEACDAGFDNGVACVPGVNASCAYCSASCEVETVTNGTCGDGIVQAPEECDGTAGVGPGQICTSSCTLENLTQCGDGIIQGAEGCDLGSDNTATCSAGYGETCSYCSLSCQPGTLIGPCCGDGIVQAPEECDGTTGVSANETCTAQCTIVSGCHLSDPMISYEGPVYDNGSIFIDSASRIALNATSTCGEPSLEHAETPVDASLCGNASLCTAWNGTPGRTPYTGPYGLDGEGCYAIYARAVAGNATTQRRACVFHDATPPILTKTVHEPAVAWNGTNPYYPAAEAVCSETACYTVTRETRIELSCTDSGEVQSGVARLCYTVGLDGDDVTETYCARTNGTMALGACCTLGSANLTFHEESWHRLSYMCSDRVNKTSAPDTEYFKVGGDSFEIELVKKWNLISVPFTPLDSSPDAVFGGLANAISVWTYENGTWYVWSPDGPSDLPPVEPGVGYWVLMDSNETLLVAGREYTEAQVPAYRPIETGWNLVGYYGTDNRTGYHGSVGSGRIAACVFSSIASSAWSDAVTSLVTYWQLDDPNAWHELNASDRLDPGAGYWLFSAVPGLYADPTTC